MATEDDNAEDSFALKQIAEVLDGKEWDIDTLDYIAEVLRRRGFQIRDPLLGDEG